MELLPHTNSQEFRSNQLSFSKKVDQLWLWHQKAVFTMLVGLHLGFNKLG